MPPVDFEQLTKNAFDSIKNTVGIEAIYKPKSGGFKAIRGIFDNIIQEVDPDTEIHISSNAFTFGVKLDDLPLAPANGDKVVVKNTEYRVIEIREDGVLDVSVVLILHKVNI